MNPNVETFIGCDAEYDQAKLVIYGAPFDSTTSFRPGARFGPAAIRHESFGLETYSPYQDRDLTDCQVFDSGDLELSFGSPRAPLDDIRARAEEILADGKFPLLVGGEHLVTLGAVEAVFARHPDLEIIHFDAHTDLRTDYLGVELSHACVMRRCWELLGDGRIHQFGIRSGEKQEFDWAKSGHTDFHPFRLDGLSEALEGIGGAPVYFTVDLDVMDPSVFPGTGTPEPGGVDFLTLMRAVTEVCGKANLIGCDVNELCPPCDPTGASTAAACKIIREMLIAALER